MRYDPRRFEALLNMHSPVRAEALQQLLCVTNWMRSFIPAYAAVIAPLHSLMEQTYAKKRSRTKKAIARVSLSDNWTDEHQQAFNTIKAELASAKKLAFQKDDYDICLFTDASETHWSGILTRVPADQRSLTF